jgi:hypothetical protein
VAAQWKMQERRFLTIVKAVDLKGYKAKLPYPRATHLPIDYALFPVKQSIPGKEYLYLNSGLKPSITVISSMFSVFIRFPRQQKLSGLFCSTGQSIR